MPTERECETRSLIVKGHWAYVVDGDGAYVFDLGTSAKWVIRKDLQ
jgi:hypothetical protein